MESIYSANGTDRKFRHLYSEIFSQLALIDQEGKDEALVILAQNIQIINDEYQGEDEEVRASIFKFYDHTNLDINRINYAKEKAKETYSKLVQFEKKITDLTKDIGKKKKELDQLDKKITDISNDMEDKKRELEEIEKNQKESNKQNAENQKDMQWQSITILSIFATVVMAFAGGFSTSKSIISNLGNAPIDQLLLITLVVGLILFDITAFLLGFIWMLNKGSFPGMGIIKKVNKWGVILILVVWGWGFTPIGSFKSSITPLKSVPKQTVIKAVSYSPSVTNRLVPNTMISPQPVTNRPALNN